MPILSSLHQLFNVDQCQAAPYGHRYHNRPGGSLAWGVSPACGVISDRDASAPGSRCAVPTRALACRPGGVPRAGVPSMPPVLWLTPLGILYIG